MDCFMNYEFRRLRGLDDYAKPVHGKWSHMMDAFRYACVGINEIENSHELQIFPNPNNGEFTLHAANLSDNNSMIEVSNIVGQVVYREDVKTPSTSLIKVLNIGDLGKGMYFVKLINNNEESVMRVIVR